MPETTHAAAIDSFKNVVGIENVLIEQEDLRNYATTTFKTDRKVVAVVLPENVQEIKACLAIANKHQISLYPISTGLNVGYGSRVPTADNCVILELKRMNQILYFSEELAYVTIEPGVTQQQLFEFLKEKKSALWMDATGSFVSHSMIGNIAERGSGHTPKGDHFANVGGMEIVLPNGDCMHTGFGRFPNAKAAGIYRWGVGPYIDGLFTQSNLGIITQVTLWLMPAPEYFQSFLFSIDDHQHLEELINLLRPLRLDGTINSAMHIGNDYKVLSSIQRYPWEKTAGKTPLSQAVLKEFAETWDFGAWNASGALYGSKKEVALARRRIKKQLKKASFKIKKLRFIDGRMLKLAEKIQAPYYHFTGVNLPVMLKLIKPLFDLTKGIPSDAMIASTYWRKKNQIPSKMNPDIDGCGLLWCSPIAPTDGKYALELWEIIRSTFLGFGFEPTVTMTLLTERAMGCIIGISYDREVEGEDEKARQCHDELLSRLITAGYYPYRLGIQSMDSLPESEQGYQKLMKALKEGLDPNNILAPGRYEN